MITPADIRIEADRVLTLAEDYLRQAAELSRITEKERRKLATSFRKEIDGVRRLTFALEKIEEAAAAHHDPPAASAR